MINLIENLNENKIILNLISVYHFLSKIKNYPYEKFNKYSDGNENKLMVLSTINIDDNSNNV